MAHKHKPFGLTTSNPDVPEYPTQIEVTPQVFLYRTPTGWGGTTWHEWHTRWQRLHGSDHYFVAYVALDHAVIYVGGEFDRAADWTMLSANPEKNIKEAVAWIRRMIPEIEARYSPPAMIETPLFPEEES